MTETFFTQVEWQGIPFAELGVPLNPDSPAGPEFYNAFYAELQRRYPTWEELPSSWRATKRESAVCLRKYLTPQTRVLSFGAGIGAVEKSLVTEFNFENLFMWDFSRRAAYYSPELTDRYLSGDKWPSVTPGVVFDAIYLVQVLYAFERGEAIDTLRRLAELVVPGGVIILMDTSRCPSENGADGLSKSVISNVVTRTRHSLSRIRHSTWPSSRSEKVGHQGWGWQRDNQVVQEICIAAGLHEIEMYSCANQAITLARVQ